jgi:cell division protein FtsB
LSFEELSFSWSMLQWAVLSVIGFYTWLIGRQSASAREMLELRTRLTTLEAQIAQMPNQSQVTELISKLSRTEAQFSSLSEQFSGVARRLETINNYLLQHK